MSVLQPVLPVLSLPSAVLFPRAFLELNLEGERLLCGMGEWLAEGAIWGIAAWRGKPSASWEYSVPIFRTIGVGHIVHRESQKSSVRRLVLEGLARGRILGDCQARVPATIQVELLRDHVNVEGSHRKELAQAFGRLARTARQVAAMDAALREPIRRVLTSHPHPGVVADLLAHYCVRDTYTKQCILDEIDVCKRVRLVYIQLAQRIACHAPHLMPRFP